MYRRNNAPAFAERKSSPGFRQSYAHTVCLALAWGVMLALVIGGAARLMHSRMFSVQRVEISGQYPHVPHAPVRQIIAPVMGLSQWQLPMKNLAKRIHSLSPWVESVSMRRMLPHGLMVHIDERRAVAYFNQNALMDEQMQVFTPHTLPVVQMIHLYGPEDQAQSMWSLAKEWSNVVQSLGWVIESVRRSKLGYSIQIRHGASIVLGREQMRKRLERLVEAYPWIVASEHALSKVPANIDLRYANGLAIQWKVQDRSITS